MRSGMKATVVLEVEFPEGLDQGDENWDDVEVWDTTILCYVGKKDGTRGQVRQATICSASVNRSISKWVCW